MATFRPGAGNGPRYGTMSADGARLRLLSALLFGILSGGRLYPLKMGQDTRDNGRGLSW